MKKSFIHLLLIVILSNLEVNAQLERISYGNANNISALCEQDNYLWIGTDFGLFKRHKNGNLVAHFTQENSGLIYNSVQTLAIDFANNLWIGTHEGLSCYNTNLNTWQSYDENNSGLPENDVMSISIDPSGILWIGTWGGGLVKFDGENWLVYNEENSGISGDLIWSVFVSETDVKWIGTRHGLSKFDGNSWTIYDTYNSPLLHNDVYTIIKDLDGLIWIGTRGGGLAKFDGSNWTIFDTSNSSIPNNAVLSLLQKTNDELWVGTYDGLAKYNTSTWEIFNSSNSGLPDNIINTMFFDANDNMWIGTNFGITKYDNTNWLTYNFPDNFLPSNCINVIFQDNSSNLWFGTERGLVKYDGINWTALNTSNSNLTVDEIDAIVEDNEGYLWIAIPNSGLAKFKDSVIAIYDDVNSGLPGTNITSLKIDLTQNIWISTFGNGIAKFDGSSWTVYNSSNSPLPDDSVYEILIDSNGNKWFCTWDGLVRFNELTGWIVFNTGNSGIPDNIVTNISEDTIGNFWVGTSDGLAKFDGTNWTIYNEYNSELPTSNISKIYIDEYNIKWIGYFNGLSKFDNENFINYEVESIVFDILMDNNSNLWCGTWDMLYKFTCQNPIVDFFADTVCFPDNVTSITNQSSIIDVFTKYEWDIGNNDTIDFVSQNCTYLFQSPGIYPVKLTASNTVCKQSLTKNVTVGILPDIEIVSSLNRNFCYGQETTLSISDNNANSSIEYDFFWSTEENASDISVSESGNYSVIVSNYNCFDSAHININVQKPFENEQICLVTVDTSTWKNKIIWESTDELGSSGFYVHKEIAYNIYSVIGYVPFGEESFFIDYSSSPEAKGEKYKLTVIDTCGNESEMSDFHKTMNLTLSSFGNTMGLSWNYYEVEDGSFTPSLYYIFRGTEPDNLELVDSVSGSFNSWNDVDVYEVYYYMVGAVRDGCGSNSKSTYTSFSNKKDNTEFIGIYELSGFLPLSIYPNPATNQITISLPRELQNTGYELRITDITGKELKVHQVESLSSVVSIDVSGFETGVYFVEVLGERVYRGRVVVE
ncbi:MAG: T9SS type A sorting domain-containing protein [Bacteroidales bacterium]|nr:T9SS type A sorting domain-containing protein [Bacteroidales bacterium]